MEKFNLKDLVNIQNSLHVLIDSYSIRLMDTESEEKTLEKINELIRGYRID